MNVGKAVSGGRPVSTELPRGLLEDVSGEARGAPAGVGGGGTHYSALYTK